MADEFPLVASAQYGDMKGTVAADLYEGTGLREMFRGRLPKGCVPVGVEVYFSDGKDRQNASVYILGIDTSQTSAVVGQDLIDYARSVDSVPVIRYSCNVKVEELLPFLKRFELVIQSRMLEDKPMHLVRDEPDDEDELLEDEDEDQSE